MKKLFFSILSLLVCFGSSSTCFAVSVPGSQTIDVKAKSIENTEKPIVYNVDLSWDEMSFTYQRSGSKTWNPATHTYTDSIVGKWSDGKSITVTNHSNTSINANFAFKVNDSYKELSGSFSKEQVSLNTAEGTVVANAPKESTVLTVSGTPNNKIVDGTVIGAATIMLTAK